MCISCLKYADLDHNNFLETFQRRKLKKHDMLLVLLRWIAWSLFGAIWWTTSEEQTKQLICSISNHPPFNTKSRYNIYIHGLKGKNKVHVWGGDDVIRSGPQHASYVSRVCLFYILFIEIQGITYVIYVTHCQDFWTGPHIDFILA